MDIKSRALRHAAFPKPLERSDLIRWFREGRRRSAEIFKIPKPEQYYTRPIELRNPIVFYEGHLPSFAVNTLIKLTLEQPGIDAHYEDLFARGIDPDSVDGVKDPTDVWPTRECVQEYGRKADALVEDALSDADLGDGEAAIGILEHEQMHQETLLYMFQQMPHELKIRREPLSGGQAILPAKSKGGRVLIPAGDATVGGSGFGWDNEFPAHRVHVPAFEIDVHNVTNGDYLDYMRATNAAAPHFWTQRDGEWFVRGMFEFHPLPLDWPVYVTHDEATAYARWRDSRLPSEAEYHRAAFGTPEGIERPFPWGDTPADATRGNFGFTHWDPVPVGSYPAGASAWGVHDLAGNGWEWTSTVFDGFEGFKPMKSYPVYSVDFFDSKHYVLKGGSPVTAFELVRPGFRNWFRPNYPYVFATFRCVRDA